ncbi:MAG: hypothetical protein AB7O68_26205 [Pirellulales bacterium]
MSLTHGAAQASFTHMPRRARSIVGGYAYHVLNRANGRLRFPSRQEMIPVPFVLRQVALDGGGASPAGLSFTLPTGAGDT